LLSLIVFLAGQVLPGDPGRAILGPLAASSAVQSLDAQLGVNRPLLPRYLSWLGGLLHGDMGISYSYRSAVAPFVGSALFNSLKLAALAFVIVVPLGIAGGVVAALRAGRLTDRVISVTGLTLASVPEFVSGIVVIIVFGVTLKLLPVSAAAGPGASAGQQFRHLILPAIPLIFVLFGYFARMARAGTIDALASDYTRTAVLKGLPRRTHDHRHRDADRVPRRRPGRGGDPLQLPGDRGPHLQGSPGEGLPHARGRGAHRRRHLCRGNARGRPPAHRAQPATARRGHRRQGHQSRGSARVSTGGRA
jgi:ABC-type dipeptide/oligopeptide/nickel transport system permease component